MADFFSICSLCHYSRYEKKIGGHRIRFFGNWGRKLQFLQAFVCVSIASPQVHYTKPLQQKKLYLDFFFQKPPEPSWYISLGNEKEINGGHRACFSSTNKTVSYRHWHSCQTSQIRRSQTIRFRTRPLHPMDWPWCSLLNSELWTRSIAIRFRSSRGSLSSDVTTGSSYLKLVVCNSSVDLLVGPSHEHAWSHSHLHIFSCLKKEHWTYIIEWMTLTKCADLFLQGLFRLGGTKDVKINWLLLSVNSSSGLSWMPPATPPPRLLPNHWSATLPIKRNWYEWSNSGVMIKLLPPRP